jgi:murein DD-endopeptidase MepM/ murein hydrolase activator NlpD
MNKLWLICCVCLPLRHLKMTSGYGYRIHPITGEYKFHSGVDLRARNDTVYAVLPGVVSATGYDNLLGIYEKLDHGDFQTTYGHLSEIFVSPGDSVSAATAIGITGSTGRVTGEHLHFSIQYRHSYIDPLAFFYAIFKKQINY